MLSRLPQTTVMASILLNTRGFVASFVCRSSLFRPSLHRCFLSTNPDDELFLPGRPVMVEVTRFGPIGASVDIIGSSHDETCIVTEDEPALGKGLVLQQEIHYYRQARNNLDVVVGEILPAFVEKHNEETGNYILCLREYGGKRKAESIGSQIMQRLKSGQGVPVGDKSSPDDIASIFPGVSKGSFKKAVAALYKQRKVRPGEFSVQLYDDDD